MGARTTMPENVLANITIICGGCEGAAYNVCNEKQRDSCLVLIAYKTKVFFHTVESCIANIHPD